MTAPLIDEETFERELAAKAAEHRRRRLEKVGLEGVTWLALVPAWTGQLARACGFPTNTPSSPKERSVEEFVVAAEVAGLCKSSRSRRPELAIWSQVKVLAPLGRYLSEPMLGRALELLRQLPEGRPRARALVQLAPWRSSALLGEAGAVVQAIEDPGERARACIDLARVATGDRAEEWLGKALKAARAIPDPARRGRSLARLAPSVSGGRRASIVQEALAAADRIETPQDRAAILLALAPELPGGGISMVLDTVERIENPLPRAEALVSLAAFVPSEHREELLREAMRSTETISDPIARSALLLDVVQLLADAGQLDTARQVASAVEPDDARALACGIVAARAARAGHSELVAGLIGQARAALAVTVEAGRAVTVLAQIAELLGRSGAADPAASLLDDAARAANGLPGATDDLHPLVTLGQSLAVLGRTGEAYEVAQQALQLARTSRGARKRAGSLLSILRLLPEEEGEKVRREVLSAVRDIADPLDRVPLLSVLLPQLDDPERQLVLEETVKQAARAGTELTFLMPDAVRTEVLDLMADASPADLQAKAADIAARLLKARDDGEHIAAPIQRWALLAAKIDSRVGLTPAAQWFDEQLEQALEARDIGLTLDWIATGTALEQVFGGELSGIIRYANRRLELINRRLQDDRHLQHFLERRDQTAAFRDLLDDPGPAWALHYLGAGGVGKTMLLRYLTRLADSTETPSSRVDFDYLSPDYPVKRPAQLLLELMAELKQYAKSEREESVIESFRDNVVQLHEATAEGTPGDPLAGIHGPEFQSAMQSFSDYLQLLCERLPDRNIVFFLDTCEELAKFQPLGASLPNVEATFEIIERIHDAVPEVRVVFAGRRLLARSGHGRAWESEAEGSRVLLPISKSYLRLYTILGFTRQEAHTFLTRVKKLAVPPETEEAMLLGSRDRTAGIRITWHPPRRESTDPRYNPFDLAIYVDWVREVGPSAVDQISAGDSDPYIERRIIGRIRQDDVVEQLLPAAVLLRRFDENLIRPAFRGSDPAFSDAIRDLTSQEWVDIRDERSGVTVLQIDPNLLPRLRAHYDRRPAYLTAARQSLAPAVRQRIEQSGLGDLSAELVSSAIDILSPAAGAALWHRLSLRAAADGRWDWAQQLTGRLLAEEDGVVPASHAARAAVRATFTSALLHGQVATELATHWAEVGKTARQEPDATVREWLLARYQAGIVASVRGKDTVPPPEAVASLWEGLRQFPGERRGRDPAEQQQRVEQLAASCCAAVEAMVEAAEADGEPLLDAATVAGWSAGLERHGVSAPVRAFAEVLAARALALDPGRQQQAQSRLRAADRLVRDATGPVGQHWLDWVAPDSLRDRVRLEAVRLSRLFLETPNFDRLEAWGRQARSELNSVDSERLAAAVLQTRMAWGTVPIPELEEWEAAAVYEPRSRPICNAHHAAPPLFVAVARGWLALGQAGRAITILENRRAAASQTGSDPLTVRAAEDAQMEVVRRMRLVTSTDPVLLERLANSADPAEAALALSVVALSGDPAEAAAPALARAAPSAWWRCQTALLPGAVDRLRKLGERTWGEPGPALDDSSTAPEVERALDREEWLRLVNHPRQAIQFSADRWADAHPGHTEMAVRLMLRAGALGLLEEPLVPGEPGDPGAGTRSRELTTWGERIGFRRLAELALEEGELLALRLPREAEILLRLARWSFFRSDDPVGLLISTIRAVLAKAHSRATIDDRRPYELDLQLAYGAVRQAGGLQDQPDFEELRQQARRPDARHLADLSDPNWAGWLQRMYLCLVWCLSSPRGRPPKLARGSVGSSPTVELDLNPAEQPEGLRRRERLTTLGKLALVPLAAFVGGALITGVLDLVAPDLPGWVVLPILALLPFVVGVLVEQLGALRHQMHAFLAARTLTELTITPSADGSRGKGVDAWPQVLVSMQLRYRRPKLAGSRRTLLRALSLYADMVSTVMYKQGPRELRLGQVHSIRAQYQLPPPGPYGLRAALVPPSVLEELGELRSGLTKTSLSIPADIGARLAGLPWEAFLALARRSDDERHDTIEIYRRADPLPPTSRPDRPVPAGGVHVVASRTWWVMATRGWSDWTPPSLFYSVPEALEQHRPEVLHLIGRPVSSGRHYSLQVAGGDDRLKADLEASVRATGAIIDGSSLPLDRVSLVVVQAEPFELVKRVDTDRDEAAKLRMFGNEVFRAGAGLVVVVPALPAPLGEEVLRILALHLQQRSWSKVYSRGWTERATHVVRQRLLDLDPTILRLLAAVRQIRTTIAGWPKAVDPAAFLELSFDVCLYARHHLRGISATDRISEALREEGSRPPVA
jgi:hypothetical protein